MNMIELIGGIALGGVVGIALKDKITGQKSQNENIQREMNSLNAENEKISRRNKELERQVEDLLSELNKVRRQAKTNDDNNDDLQDELDKAKKDLKVIKSQNDELTKSIKEYKIICETQEAEISLLKGRLQ